MEKNKKSKALGAYLPINIANVLEARAKSMGWSLSKYLGYIVAEWYAKGCPPINSIDEAVNKKPPTLAEIESGLGEFDGILPEKKHQHAAEQAKPFKK